MRKSACSKRLDIYTELLGRSNFSYMWVGPSYLMYRTVDSTAHFIELAHIECDNL